MSLTSKDNIKGTQSVRTRAKKVNPSLVKQTAVRLNGFFMSVNLLQFTVSAAFLLMSVCTLLMAMFGFIQYFWLATAMSMLASVSTMLSLYSLYDVFKSRKSGTELVREAIKRSVHFRN